MQHNQIYTMHNGGGYTMPFVVHIVQMRGGDFRISNCLHSTVPMDCSNSSHRIKRRTHYV